MIWAYEMAFDGELPGGPDIECVSFSRARFEEYRAIYNACFRPMRAALDIRPYDWYSDYAQMAPRAGNVFLHIEGGAIVGAVACIGSEIDDLIVAPNEQGKGHGRRLLAWAMHHIRAQGHREITLHVADWNRAAVKLYKDMGFAIKKRERIG